VTVFGEVVPVALELSTAELLLEPSAPMPCESGEYESLKICKTLVVQISERQNCLKTLYLHSFRNKGINYTEKQAELPS